MSTALDVVLLVGMCLCCVVFAALAWNLIDDPSPLGQFDVIFCRNVLLFFDLFMRGAVLGRMARSLAPDGALYLGLAETVLGVTDRFVPIGGQRAAYTHAPAPAQVARAS